MCLMRRWRRTAVRKIKKSFLVIKMAEQGVEASRLIECIDRSSPYDHTVFDCDNLSWRTVARGNNAKMRHVPKSQNIFIGQ